MKEYILQSMNNGEGISMTVVILNNIIAILGAFFIMFTYKITYFGTAYSHKVNVSIGCIVVITSMIMSVISSNIALSLGMVGALSIIRFRTAIKDIRDAVFIFLAVAFGVGCGVSQYALVGIGSISVLIFLILTKERAIQNRQLLVVEALPEAQNQVEAVVGEHIGRKVHKVVKNTSLERCETIYSIDEKVLRKADEEHMIDISERLMKIKGVLRVHIVKQQDDISR